MQILERIPCVTVGQKLKAARETLEPALTQEELAHRLAPVTVAMVRNWETDRTEMPKPQAMRVAEIYDIDWRWFFDSSETLPKISKEKPNAKVEVGPAAELIRKGFATSAAVRSFVGVLAGLEGDETYFQEEELPFEVPTAFLIGGDSKIDRHTVLRISGRSLEPRIRSGSRVITYDDPVLHPNSLVAAEDKEHRVWLKVLREGIAGNWELHSINEKGAKFRNLEGWNVKGYVIAILHDVDEPGPNAEWRGGRPLKA